MHAQRVGILAVPETDDVATGAQTWEQQSGAISCAFERKLEHPRHGMLTVDRYLEIFGWHSPHHEAHITSLREREGW